jgi:hypothetical protein
MKMWNSRPRLFLKAGMAGNARPTFDRLCQSLVFAES